ncbi:Protein C10 [Trinorchestia longiramus]|nr:Protein C10 [Trinorchestia longiramus]
MSAEEKRVNLTCAEAKECLNVILGWVRSDDSRDASVQELVPTGSVEEAREAAGNDMVALMTRVYPIIATLTAAAIAPLGYSKDGAGVLQFERSVQALLPQDAELARLHSELRSYYLPAVVFPPPNSNSSNP